MMDPNRRVMHGTTRHVKFRLPLGGRNGHSSLRGVCPRFGFRGMDALRKHGKGLGLSHDEIESALRLGRLSSDASWVTAADLGEEALKIAVETMESGRQVEYACYQNDGTPQGRAVIKLQVRRTNLRVSLWLSMERPQICIISGLWITTFKKERYTKACIIRDSSALRP